MLKLKKCEKSDTRALSWIVHWLLVEVRSLDLLVVMVRKEYGFQNCTRMINRDNGDVELFGKSINEITDKDRQRIGASLGEVGFYEQFTIKKIVSVLRSFIHNLRKAILSQNAKNFDFH